VVQEGAETLEIFVDFDNSLVGVVANQPVSCLFETFLISQKRPKCQDMSVIPPLHAPSVVFWIKVGRQGQSFLVHVAGQGPAKPDLDESSKIFETFGLIKSVPLWFLFGLNL
jgi:hypothetical protein